VICAHNRGNETWECINTNDQFNFQQLNCHTLFLYLCRVECSPYINPLNPLRNVRIITANIDPLHSRPHIGKIKSIIMAVSITTIMLWIRMWDRRISSVLTPIAYLHYSYYNDKKTRRWRNCKTEILETKLPWTILRTQTPSNLSVIIKMVESVVVKMKLSLQR